MKRKANVEETPHKKFENYLYLLFQVFSGVLEVFTNHFLDTIAMSHFGETSYMF